MTVTHDPRQDAATYGRRVLKPVAHRNFPATAAVAALVVLALVLVAARGFAEPVELTIVHFNDLDRIEESGGQGGIARLAAVIKAERARHDNVLVTFAGDTISPSLLSGFDQGAHMIRLLNRLDLTAMAIGNHEYDFGPEVAKQRFAEARFPILGANNIDLDGEIIDGAQASILVDVGRFTVGIFGLTTLGTTVKSSPGGVTFRPVEEVAAEQSAALRAAGAHLVIALAHTDVGEDWALIEQGAVDLLLSGDDHLLRLDYSGDVLFAESAEQADWVTVIDLTLDEVERRGDLRFEWRPSFRIIDTARVAPDPELAAAAQVYLDRLSAELEVEIGVTETELDSRRATVRGGEAAIGNLIADAMRAATGADVALTNGGGIRANRIYEPGTMLTRRDLLSELPFGNKTVVLRLTGRDLVTALENGLSKIEEGAGRFPHLSGVRVVYDPGRPAGERVLEVTRHGVALDLAATFLLATNDYLGNGGDGYDVLEEQPRVVDAYAGTLMAAQVIEYVTARGAVAAVVDGRLRTVP